MILRTGIDLVEIARLENVNALIRERFQQRIFTSRELEDTGGDLASLAGRFAVKEAVSKALGTGIGQVSWQEIEVVSGHTGEPELVLHGTARQLADTAGLTTWSISISHTQTYAVAMAVAFSGDPGL